MLGPSDVEAVPFFTTSSADYLYDSLVPNHAFYMVYKTNYSVRVAEYVMANDVAFLLSLSLLVATFCTMGTNLLLAALLYFCLGFLPSLVNIVGVFLL